MQNYAAHVIGTVINQTGAAEGGLLPPKQAGNVRIQPPVGFRIVRTEAILGKSVFTLTWKEESSLIASIDHYEIYYALGILKSASLIFASTAQSAPAHVTVTADAATPISFTLQTVLKNGFHSDIQAAPTCTGITAAPVITNVALGSNTVGLGNLQTGTTGELITWDGAGQPTTIAPGSAGLPLVSQGGGAEPTWGGSFVRELQFQNHPVIVSGAATYSVLDTKRTTVLPFAADSTVSIWWRVPDNADVTAAIDFKLNYSWPDVFLTGDPRDVKLVVTPRLNNTNGGAVSSTQTLDFVIAWHSISVASVVAGSSYSQGQLLQLQIRRDTSVANNCQHDLNIAAWTIQYRAVS
jgi:hypothetical protein